MISHDDIRRLYQNVYYNCLEPHDRMQLLRLLQNFEVELRKKAYNRDWFLLLMEDGDYK
jgi:hypothetical protein